MSIKIDLETISKEGETIFGNIYFEYKNIIFPEKEWNDFIVIVLNWWSSSLLKLVNNQSISEVFDFMDGPLFYKVIYTRENEFDLYFVRKEEVIDRTTISSGIFVKSLLKEINSLLRYINERNWEGDEIDMLKINYNKLLKSKT